MHGARTMYTENRDSRLLSNVGSFLQYYTVLKLSVLKAER
jgi:hypothetical protein